MRIVRSPYIWLLVQAAGLILFLEISGRFEVEGVEWPDDVRDYMTMSDQPLAKMMNSPRPIGYPLFLWLVREGSWLAPQDSPKFALLPQAHLLAHVFAVCVFYAGLRGVFASGWLTLAVSSTLLYSNILLLYGTYPLSDSLASSLSILTIGTLLYAISHPGDIIAWIAVALASAWTYHTGLKYLFLIVLVPVLGIVILRLARSSSDWRRLRWTVAAGLIVTSLVPWAGYCSLRWWLIGEFKLIANSNSALWVWAGPFVTQELVPELPESVQPLAQHMVDLKTRMSNGQLPAGYEKMDRESEEYKLESRWYVPGWQPPDYNEFLWTKGVISNLFRPIREDCQKDCFQADQAVFKLFPDATMEWFEQQYGRDKNGLDRTPPLTGEQRTELEQKKASELAWAAIKARRGAVVLKAIRLFVIALYPLLLNGYLLDLLLVLWLVVTMVWYAIYTVKHLWTGRQPPNKDTILRQSYAFEFNIMLLVGLSFALSLIATCIAGTAVIGDRYTDAAAIFVPGAFVIAFFVLAQKFCSFETQ